MTLFEEAPYRVATPDDPYARVTLRSSTKQAIQDAAPKDANGNFIDPNTGQSIPADGPFHYGHKPGFEYWRNRDLAQQQGWSRDQFIEFHVDVAAALLEAGADVNRGNRFGNGPLFVAVFNSRGRGEMIELLRSHGANPHATNATGQTPAGLSRLIANYDVSQFFADLNRD